MSKKLLFSKGFQRTYVHCDKDKKGCAMVVLQKCLFLLKMCFCHSLLSKRCPGEKPHSLLDRRCVHAHAEWCVHTRALFCCFLYIFNKCQTPSHDWQKRTQKSYFQLKTRQPFTPLYFLEKQRFSNAYGVKMLWTAVLGLCECLFLKLPIELAMQIVTSSIKCAQSVLQMSSENPHQIQ